MDGTADEQSRPTTAVLYTELGKLREEVNRGLNDAKESMNRGIEKFEERITARLENIAQAQSQLALKNAHDIGVLETRVDAHQLLLEKLGDVATVAHAASARVDSIERARADEAQQSRVGQSNRWQLIAVVIGSVVLVAMDHVWSLLQVHP